MAMLAIMSLPRAKAYRVIDKSAGDKAIRRVYRDPQRLHLAPVT
jgi:hypothetical protein